MYRRFIFSWLARVLGAYRRGVGDGQRLKAFGQALAANPLLLKAGDRM
jgi:hypothetical protein